ncbi:tannase/feruloyl esterase family alpha/beta hydrolase [Agrobacterium rosae]|uniref:Tannase/feruloyl esterase family alpha/beta hydrolase n=2 Tax=Agrobacterium rosae TaxID=1972867 RepID=A0AAE5RZY6_9HYPH|nr:tannase/feruloyl esterase family alpha/beta hydrolase [Agrobacterium rosae]KAA3521630.1 tannase/feruloyl esterase family alpha/beta hydrolase [Agrobacterium rosae]MQB48563.1 tannase/feruloyl esterase family alpha/beta hydrolase [Agrobacterium rosae]POO53210.1 tannase/feruloyl esterase family alpha/beta hydrolase [Agrobacterium rosae]
MKNYSMFSILATLILSGISSMNAANAAPSTDFAARCLALKGATVEGGVVTLAEATQASALPVTEKSVPDHCLVRGAMNQRTGIDGQPYALQFELRLPVEWNKRFYYQGGSGVDGILFPALGTYSGGGNLRNALLDGYTVVTTDSGHQEVANKPNGRFSFGADPQARLEYGNMQVPQVTAAAKTLIRGFYGELPQYSYFYGSSNGGRQAMIAAQQYPDLFDGVLASAPGFRLAQASIQALYQAKIAAKIAPKGPDGRPDIKKTLTDSEKAIVVKKILDACDALDGASDGMVSRISACHPDPAEWTCKAGETTDCLQPEKASYIKALFAGAYTSDGRAIYSKWPFDPGMVEQTSNSFYFLFAGEASHIYTTPPTITEDIAGYGLSADIDREFAKISATDGVFTVPGTKFTNAESPDMDAFRAKGGKLIIFNGTADLAFSVYDVADYYKKVEERYGADGARQFARVFFVPGMAHTRGGAYGTDQFNAFGALTEWVEKGVAPTRLTATARADAGVKWPGRTRPICLYPAEAVYDGHGDIEKAESFVCQ